MIMQKTILVKPGERKKLKDIFRTTYPTVRAALKGDTASALSKSIRAAALERGGVEAGENKLAELAKGGGKGADKKHTAI